ncbi:hypothetical protein AMJ80_01495 [bacterium SM23_31]|nr:MAG: hypothetical protein AMJ80_01495 [bacterium SM23_31]
MKKLFWIVLSCTFIFLPNSGLFASGTITGKVLDIDGNVLSGVNIRIKGTDLGTVSRTDGKFFLSGSLSGTQTLIISHILFITEEVSVNVKDDSTIDIIIKFTQERSFYLSEVVVTATKFNTEPEKVPQTITLIPGEEVEKGHFYNVGEMLDYVPGVRIVRSGTVGASIGVSIRSLYGSKSLILIDGKPLNDAWEGGVNWNTVPTAMVERIEVVRGPSSALYGSQATGGVINVFTKSPLPGFHGWVSAGYEMNGSRKISDADADGYGRAGINASNFQLNGSYKSDNTSHLVSFGLRNSDQSFPSPYKNKWNNYDIKYKLNHLFSEKMTSNLNIDIHNDNWRNEAEDIPAEDNNNFFAADFFTKYQGKPGIFSGRIYMNYTNNTNKVISTDLKTGSKSYRLGLITDYTLPFTARNASLKLGLDSYLDYADVNYEKAVVDMTYLGVSTINIYDKKTGQIDQEQADTFSGTYGSNAQEYNLNNAALFAQYNQNITNRLNIVIGGRFDIHSEFGSIFNPKAGITFEVFDIHNFTTNLKLNYGAGFRAPTMRALFSKSLGGYGDPNLSPEKTNNFDIGIFERFGNFGFLELTYFKMDVEDLLINDKQGSTGEGYWVFIPDNQSGIDTLSFRQRKNLGDYSPSGWELGFKIKPHRQITLTGAYSYLDPGDFTFQTSKNRYNISINAYQPAGKNKFEAEILYNYTGDGYYFDFKRNPFDSYAVTDGRIAFDFQNLFRISLHGKNLTDKKYRLSYNAWQPGRTFVIRIDTRF